MIKLLFIFAVALFFALYSEKYTGAVLASGKTYVLKKDTALILLIIALTLFTGLRVSYNDTWNYINGYNQAPNIRDFLSNPKNLNPFTNPLFYAYRSLLRSLGCSAQALVFTTSMVAQTCFVLFFKRYSRHFTFSIFLYFTLGTFCFSMAAMKQVIAMAILTLAIPQLEKKCWIRFYLLVTLAMLCHTYALAFVILPFFLTRPWKFNTVLLIGSTVFLLFNFREAITSFMDQVNEMGKTLADYEVFDEHTVNTLRLLVYAIPPLISLVFRRWVNRDTTVMDNLMMQMSIISLSFMLLGTQSGANMFARMAMYFELGTICYLPKMLDKIFEKQSYRLVAMIACVCFMGFFVYANRIANPFGQDYRWIFG